MLSRSLTVPHTYAEWVTILDQLKNKEDDDAVLRVMQQGTIEWQTGVAERFTKKFIDVINSRMNGATDHFQKEMSRAHGQERELVQALLNLRKEMKFLAMAINVPAIPDQERRQYFQLIISQANSIQNSLEESAKKDRTGKLASIIRNNRVNAF